MLIVLSTLPIDQQGVMVPMAPVGDLPGRNRWQDPIDQLACLDREPGFGRPSMPWAANAGVNMRRRMIAEIDHHDDSAK